MGLFHTSVSQWFGSLLSNTCSKKMPELPQNPSLLQIQIRTCGQTRLNINTQEKSRHKLKMQKKKNCKNYQKKQRNIATPIIVMCFLQHGIQTWIKVIGNLHQLHQEWIWNHLFPSMQLIQPKPNWMRMRTILIWCINCLIVESLAIILSQSWRIPLFEE